MARQLNLIPSGNLTRTSVSRALRRRLAATTILAVAPFLGYGRQAHADCVEGPPGTFLCSGVTNTTQNITTDDADVSTAPDFELTTAAGDGITIAADGHLQFTDEYASPITAPDTGLVVHSTGNSAANDGAITINTNGNITGGTFGIYAYNEGDGNVDITVDGQATGTTSDGIYAHNSTAGGNLTITTGAGSDITGGDEGIYAENLGSGDLKIIADGRVTGQGDDGINAVNRNGPNLIVTTGAGSDISGARDGIDAENYGDGDLDIKVYGQVTAEGSDGIDADNHEGVNLYITTGAASVISGAENGIDAENSGSGDLEITADGRVTGLAEEGIEAINSSAGENLTITTGVGSSVTGYSHGIYALNNGDGDLVVTADGIVTGYNDNGIKGENTSNGHNLIITTGVNSVATGYDDGVDGENFGNGDLTITMNGKAYGRDDGIDAENSSDSDGLTITTGAGSLSEGYGSNGVEGSQSGDGNLEITVYGTARGLGNFNNYAAGIYAYNGGSGETHIKVGAGGLSEGDYAGIYVNQSGGQDIEITNDGTTRNLSTESFDRAIVTKNGATDIENNGNLIGTVTTDLDDSYEDTLTNNGLWAMTSISRFGGGFDEINNTGTLRAANDPTSLQGARIFDLNEFNNNGGLITLVDGQAGDDIQMSADAPGALEYQGTNGRLAVDAALGPGLEGISDQLVIDGNTNGSTLVKVNVVDVTGANLVGIPVVRVVNGNTEEEHFDLDGPLNAGFFAWNLRFDEDNSWHELYTAGLGAGAFEFAAGITGMQDIWYQTAGTLLQRQADLRPIIGSTQVTPVADFAEPIEPTPVANVTPGAWLKGVGAWIDRDQDEDHNVVTDRDQSVYGIFAGFDFGTDNLHDQGDALLFGLLAGYIHSDLDFDSTNTEWTYKGPSVGAYATYLDHAFYADALVKADFLDIEIDAEDLAPSENDADTDAVNIGGRIDTGYKIGETWFVDPQATLAVVHTEIDDVDDIFGGSVEFDDATSVRGRLGLRLGYENTDSNGAIYSGDVMASVWQEFNGDNDVTIFSPGFGPAGASDDPGETFGDLSIGFNIVAPEGWSGFLRGDYQFGEDYEAFGGNAGVRYSW